MTTRKRLPRWVIGSCLGLGIAGMLLYGLTVPPCSASESEATSSSVRHTPPPQLSLNPLDPSVAPKNWQHQTDRVTTASQCDDLALGNIPTAKWHHLMEQAHQVMSLWHAGVWCFTQADRQPPALRKDGTPEHRAETTRRESCRSS